MSVRIMSAGQYQLRYWERVESITFIALLARNSVLKVGRLGGWVCESKSGLETVF